MRTHQHLALSAAAIGLSAVVLASVAACGSSNSHSSSSTSTSKSAYTIGFVTTRIPGLDLSTAAQGLQAAFDDINKNGGVNGHDLTLSTCEDNGTPTGATTCLQKLIANKSVVDVAALTLEGPVYARFFNSAKLAYTPILPISSADSSSATLAFTGGSAAYAAAGYEYLIKALGDKKIATIGSATTDPTLMAAYSAAVASKLGAQVVGGSLLLTQGQSDFLPLIARAQAAGADGVYIGFLAPGDYIPFIQAYKAAGAKFDLVGAAPSMSPAVIDAFKNAKVTLYLTSSYNPATSDGPANKEYQAVSAAADVPVSEYGQFGYGAALAIQSIIAKAGNDVTRSSFYDVASAKNVNINAGPLFPGPITRPLAAEPLYAGVGNMGAYVGKYEDGVYTQVTAKPLDTAVFFMP
jgi:branched-chain amino acid transport system substrate-binding protein